MKKKHKKKKKDHVNLQTNEEQIVTESSKPQKVSTSSPKSIHLKKKNSKNKKCQTVDVAAKDNLRRKMHKDVHVQTQTDKLKTTTTKDAMILTSPVNAKKALSNKLVQTKNDIDKEKIPVIDKQSLRERLSMKIPFGHI